MSKAFYLYRPSARTHKHVQRAFEVGAIDFALLHVWTLPAQTKQKWHDSYNWHVKTLKQYGQWGTVYPVVNWQIQELPPDDPLNTPRARLEAIQTLIRDTGVSGIVWDFEDYRAGAGHGKQQKIPKKLGDWCKEAGIHVVGGMPWNKAGGVHFSEKTYEKDKEYRGCKRLFGVPDLLPGVWIERFEDPIPYMEKMYERYGGYWIYSHVRFGQRLISNRERHLYVRDDPLRLNWWRTIP